MIPCARMSGAIAVILALAAPAAAQDGPEGQQDRGFSLMKRGAELFFRGIRRELDPLLRDLEEFSEGIEPAMRDFMAEMGPALRGLLEEVEDWQTYHPPEMLPNGDIILRRKRGPDAPDPDTEPGSDGDIEI